MSDFPSTSKKFRTVADFVKARDRANPPAPKKGHSTKWTDSENQALIDLIHTRGISAMRRQMYRLWQSLGGVWTTDTKIPRNPKI
jgi:hypothetical protein